MKRIRVKDDITEYVAGRPVLFNLTLRFSRQLEF
jgi:hypothetical protein